jgi:hypothetical protein
VNLSANVALIGLVDDRRHVLPGVPGAPGDFRDSHAGATGGVDAFAQHLALRFVHLLGLAVVACRLVERITFGAVGDGAAARHSSNCGMTRVAIISCGLIP